MNIYEIGSMAEKLASNAYPGRGIVLGITPDGKKSVAAYFIMGRSVNSRNRVFIEEADGIRTEAHDPSLMQDPSLIIYHPVRELARSLIVTNGDQTDTVRDGLLSGLSFSASLESRTFEPDAPNLTPRISGMMTLADGDFSYQMSILKSADPVGSACNRFTYSYAALAGVGHFLHTYMGDGNPLPTFTGEPERVAILDDIDAFTEEIWSSLNAENKISLAVRYYSLEDGGKTVSSRLINKYSK